jgi:hypothetical protein
MKWRRFDPVAFLLCLSFAVPCLGEVKANVKNIVINSGIFELVLSRQNGRSEKGGLNIVEGASATRISLANATDWEIQPNSVSFKLAEESKELETKQVFEICAGNTIKLFLSFKNNGNRERLLQPGYSVFLPGQNLKWWDGRSECKPHDPELTPEGILLQFPASAAYDVNNGVAIGLDPHQLLSTFMIGARPEKGGLLISFATRIVLDEGQSFTLPLCLFSFKPNFGYFDAVQRIHDLYPDLFNPTQGIRPLMLQGGGGYVFGSRATRHLQPEVCRRFCLGWDWIYCPGIIPGYWYTEKDDYDPTMGYPYETDKNDIVTTGRSFEQYHTDLHDRISAGDLSTTTTYYMIPQAADVRVLKKYPDSVLMGPEGPTTLKMKNWVRNNSEVTGMYPWGNSYGNSVTKQIGQVAADFAPSAIGFDMTDCSDKHYGGAAISQESARAWDDKGVYAATQVALAHLADVIHQQRVSGYTMGAVFNVPWTIFTATRCDASLFERPPYIWVDKIEPSRFLVGHKPVTWWQALTPEKILKNWEQLEPNQLRSGITGIYKYVRLMSLRYGTYPWVPGQEFGSKDLVDVMPVLSELNRQGWQAVPAVKGADGLWLSRYGKGIDTFIAVGNSNRKSCQAKLALYPEYLGVGYFLFSDYKGNPIKTSYSENSTDLDLGVLDSHSDAIARALVQILPDEMHRNVKIAGEAKCSWQALRIGSVEAAFIANQNQAGRLRIRLPIDAQPQEMILNGKICNYVLEDGAVSYTGRIPSECNLILKYKPKVVVECEKQDVLAFPFVGGNTPSTIQISENASEKDMFTANRLSAYFEYYQREMITPTVNCWDLVKSGNNVTAISIIRSGPSVTKTPVVKLQSDKETKISLSQDRQTLIIAGPTEQDRENAMLRLLSILDEKYVFYGVMPDSKDYSYYTVLPSRFIYKRAGLAGKVVQ